MKYLFTLLISFTVIAGYAQKETAIHEWRDHLPYNKGLQVVNTGDQVYCATQYGLFSYDKNLRSVQRYNKVNGLSDSEIADIGYHAGLKSVIVAYGNTNIDIMQEGSVVNLSDIKRKNILGKKTINRVIVEGDYAYLACGFGIVVVDLKRLEIHDTYIIGPNGSMVDVLDVAFSPDFIFAATANGIFKADRNNPMLAVFENWQKLTSIPNPNLSYSSAVWFSNELVLAQTNEGFNDDTLWIYNPVTQNTRKLTTSYYYDCHRLQSTSGYLAISYEGATEILNSAFQRELSTYRPSDVQLSPAAAVVESTNLVWIADRKLGLVKVTNSGWTGEFLAPEGPYSHKVYSISTQGDNLWVAHGGRNSVWGNLYIRDGISTTNGISWQIFNHTTEPMMSAVWDVVAIKSAPTGTKTFAATWGMGVVEIDGGEITKIHDTTNSTLEPWVANKDVTNISGLSFDNSGNLWVANTGAASLVHVLRANGQWEAYNLGGSMSGIDIGSMLVDQNGQKWIQMRKDHSLIVFDEKNPTGKQSKILNEVTGNGAIPGNKVYAMCEDQDGEIWIGTDVGIAVFYNPGAVLTGTTNFDAQRIVVSLDGYNQYLLENETVTAICVDGANQKWIGTDRAGAFLLSADGTEEIFHFTAENSPLFSNSITDIAIAADGSVYFATPNGIISFKGEATPPQPTNDNLVVYPQPVPEGYEGVVAIKGLVNNAWVKITTLSGQLVYETRAQGGQAIWNAKTMDGEKVSTGVYLVFITNEDGSETAVTKIMVIK